MNELEMPISETYERELEFMPYKESLRKVQEAVCSMAPKNAHLIDLMCGPGYLLGKIVKQRPDLKLLGVDADKRYIAHSRLRYPKIKFEVGDVRVWKPEQSADVVICTGAVHHLTYEEQAPFLEKIAGLIKPGGFGVVSDCYIDDYKNEAERKIAAARLGYEYLQESVRNGAPRDVVSALCDILRNDVMKREFKTSVKKRMPAFQKAFRIVEMHKIWPKSESEYGDYITIVR